MPSRLKRGFKALKVACKLSLGLLSFKLALDELDMLGLLGCKGLRQSLEQETFAIWPKSITHNPNGVNSHA